MPSKLDDLLKNYYHFDHIPKPTLYQKEKMRVKLKIAGQIKETIKTAAAIFIFFGLLWSLNTGVFSPNRISASKKGLANKPVFPHRFYSSEK